MSPECITAHNLITKKEGEVKLMFLNGNPY